MFFYQNEEIPLHWNLAEKLGTQFCQTLLYVSIEEITWLFSFILLPWLNQPRIPRTNPQRMHYQYLEYSLFSGSSPKYWSTFNFFFRALTSILALSDRLSVSPEFSWSFLGRQGALENVQLSLVQTKQN